MTGSGTLAAILASHWTTGTAGLAPPLYLLMAMPYVLFGLLVWFGLRFYRRARTEPPGEDRRV